MVKTNDIVLELTKQLVSIPSVTPLDHSCQDIIADYLQTLHFNIKHFPHPNKKVKNLYAKYGSQGPLFLFLGHTDVVPTGPVEKWTYHPFTPTIKDNALYGRGTQDMKSAIAAMMVATKEFLQQHKQSFNGQIAFLITSGEEGDDYLAGVPYVLKQTTQDKISWCLVGEPSCDKIIGDTIKIGRRGSLIGRLTLKGKQGHVAYPQKLKNPIHAGADILNKINTHSWCQGNKYFPPTTIECVHVACDNQATNVTPNSMTLWFAIRYSNELTHQDIQKKFTQIISEQALEYNINWEHSGAPFLTRKGKLLECTHQAIKTITHKKAKESTAGGTSDGRFIAPLGAEVIEFGTCNNTIHKINEKVTLSDLNTLPKIYYEILCQLFRK